MYIYIYNFFLTLFHIFVNCYSLGIAGADKLKKLIQCLFTSLTYLI